jgi:hypothetical protein
MSRRTPYLFDPSGYGYTIKIRKKMDLLFGFALSDQKKMLVPLWSAKKVRHIPPIRNTAVALINIRR